MTPTHKRARLLLLAAALPAVALASGHIVDIAWDPKGRFAHQASIAPGKFVELCGKLEKGRGVAWSFEAPAPLNFNIHYHQGKDVVYPAQQDQVREGRALLTVALAQDYCWMWSNKGDQPVLLRAALERR